MLTRCRLRLAAAAALALLAAGCASSTGSAPPGRTAPGGTPLSGGTAVLAEPPSATPDYIFPFTGSADFSDINIWDLQSLLYRPLY
jgi:peptide/nickel transport system substrate-binding protein